MQQATETKTRKTVILVGVLVIACVVAVAVRQSISGEPGAKQYALSKPLDGSLSANNDVVLNEDANADDIIPVKGDSCWWPTCKWGDCGSSSAQSACVARCKQHGQPACTGKCCQIGGGVQKSQTSGKIKSTKDCNSDCHASKCGYSCTNQVACYKACNGGTDCKLKSACCGNGGPKPVASKYTWWTIGGTTTDAWCTNNCPNSRNPHCADGIWCCGGSTHTEVECKDIKKRRETECGSYCYHNCFYLDHTGVCTTCPNKPICKRQLW